jgi:hypothetical protein
MSETITGKWELVNLDDLNAEIRVIHDEFATIPPTPFDPLTRVSLTYVIDGTGFSATDYERGVTYKRNFSYQFFSQNEFHSTYQIINEAGNNEIVAMGKFKILKMDQNKFTKIYLGFISRKKNSDIFVEHKNPLHLTFQRIAK